MIPSLIRAVCCAMLMLWLQTTIAKDSFQGQVSFGYGTNISNRNTENYKSNIISGKYYLAAVNKNKRPWLRAEDLERIGNISFNWEKTDFSRQSYDGGNPVGEFDDSTFDLGFIYRAPTTRWLFGLKYSKISEFWDFHDDRLRSRANAFNITVGYYAQDSFQFRGSFVTTSQTNEKESQTPFNRQYYHWDYYKNADFYGLDLGFNWVKSYAHSWLSLDFSFEAGYTQYSDTNFSSNVNEFDLGKLHVDIAYYFNEKTRLGNRLVANAYREHSVQDQSEWSFYFDRFVTSYLSLGANFGFIYYDQSIDSIEMFEGSLYLKLLT